MDWGLEWDGGERPEVLGTVIEEGRGSLPFALVHGEALVTTAAWALAEAGVLLVDLGTEWAGLVDSGEAVVLHDALCPMTPPAFIAACIDRALETGAVVVGTRPVTDTIKATDGGYVEETVDRAALVAIASPVVIPPGVVAELDGLPSLDFAELVTRLRERFAVEHVEAPPAARRVATEDDVRVLEALTRPAG